MKTILVFFQYLFNRILCISSKKKDPPLSMYCQCNKGNWIDLLLVTSSDTEFSI